MGAAMSRAQLLVEVSGQPNVGGAVAEPGRLARVFYLVPATSALPDGAGTELEQLLEYWRGVCRGRTTPERSDLDPLSIPRLLANIFIMDAEPDGVYRFSLVGESMNERYGGQLKGCAINDLLSGTVLAETLEEHSLCMENKTPVYTRNSVEVASALDDFQLYHRLILPLGPKDGPPVALLGMMSFDSQ